MRSLLAATALFILIAVAITWPQAARLATHASDHHDVYFNMWRFAWFSHALTAPGVDLLDGNIFFPEQNTLTFSDALPVAAATAMPLSWLGFPPVLVHNLVLLSGILLSAVSMFVLVRALTRNAAAATTAGVVFGFASYRFEHYMHMELQWTVWIPLSFWALHRVRTSARWRDGAALGVFVALQFLSSIYYGIYLVLLLAIIVLCVLLVDSWRKRPITGQMTAFGLSAIVALTLCLPYALPYLATRPAVGDRSIDEVKRYSAQPSSYLAASSSNRLFGAVTERFGAPEKRLFPGAVATVLAVICLVWRRSGALIYLVGLGAAFELSLGSNGFIYPLLYEHAPGFASLRAPARLGVFVLFFLAVLAGFGHAALAERLPRRTARALAALIWIVMAAEYWVAPLPLATFYNKPPALYAWLALQPRGVVAELPMPRADRLPADDAEYTYMSTFHWHQLVNGYSGYYPPSYLRTLERLRRFEPGRSVDVLRRTGVTYVIVHASSWNPEQSAAAAEILMKEPGVAVIGRFDDGRGVATVFRIQPAR